APQSERTESHSQPSPQEIYLLALLIQIADFAKLEISAEIFRDINCRELFIKLTHTQGELQFSKIANEISNGAGEVLQQVLMTDTSTINDIPQEFEWAYRVIYGNYLQAQILDMRQQLIREPENTELLTKLQYFTNEKHNLRHSTPFTHKQG